MCVLLGAILVSGLRFYRLRHYLDFTDENDNTTIGWLLTQGETLYGSVFSHHMPLAYAAAHVVALVSPTDRPAHFRAAPWAAFVALAFVLARSPLLLDRLSGSLAAALFLALASLLLPPALGHMLLADSLWGVGFATALVSFVLPLLLRRPPDRLSAAIGGLGTAMAIGSNVIAVYPIGTAALAVAAALLFSRPERTALSRTSGPFLIATAGGGAATLLWVRLFGSLPGLFEEALLFNTEVYGPLFQPEKSTLRATLASTASDWRAHLATSLAGGAFLRGHEALLAVLGAAVACGLAVLAGRSWRRLASGGVALLLAATLALCRVRGGASRGLGYDVVVLALAAVLLVVLARSRPWTGVGAAAVVLGLAVAAVSRDPSLRANPRSRSTYPPEAGAAAAYVSARTAPGERIASFPSTPGLYLLAHRRPAVDSIFYYPWQAEWERRSVRVPDTCARLESAAPRFVFVFPRPIWGVYPFEGYAPCLDALIRRKYRPVDGPGLGGLLWEMGSSTRSRAGSVEIRAGSSPRAIGPLR